MPGPLAIPAVSALLAAAARSVGSQWTRAALGREGTGMLAKAAPRLSTKLIAGGAAFEGAEDVVGADLPEVTPNTWLGAKLYHGGKGLARSLVEEKQ